ncbi:hypothetical protein AN958_01059 [Leucoagaricus sp. SymC.cos]|nr:hypothetical protein AN958_01059 [Leucoagaricus sp. SymC.cos]
MPVPDTKQALDFNSKNSEDLKKFLEEFEELAERNGLMVKEKIYMTAPHDPSCHFCKRVDCCMRMCPKAAEYVRQGWVILQLNRYYVHLDESHIR